MRHSCRALLWDTLVGRDTLVGHSCGALLWDTLVGHSCRTLLWDTLVGQSCGTLLWDTVAGHSCGTLIRDTLVTLLWVTQRAFRTRLPPEVTRQVSKMRASYETTSKSHISSPQNERFVRDFLKNSHIKVYKTSVSYETSSKSQAETPIGAHTSRSPAKQFRDSSPSKRHPLKRQSQCDSDIHLYHNSQPPDSLRLPQIFPRPHAQRAQSTAPATKCHLRHTSQPHDSLRLPRESHFHASKPTQSTAPATKSSNIISCELQQNLHRTTRLE